MPSQSKKILPWQLRLLLVAPPLCFGLLVPATHVQEVRIASYLEAAKHRAKIRHLAWATATPSCGTAAMLWTAGACVTCSRSPNSVNLDTYLEAAKYQAKIKTLAWATANPSCGTASQDVCKKSSKIPSQNEKSCLGNCGSFLWHRRYALDCRCLWHMFKKSE